jgi:hypothetical protein
MSKSDYYHGNRNLKRSYITHEWTAHQIQEFVKCARDPEYFIEKFVKIVHVDYGVIPFIPYDFQRDIIKLSFAERFVICKMPRQVGKTTVVVGIILHHALFNENYSIALLAHKEEQAIEILSRIQLAYENLPTWMQQGVVEWSKTSVELENGSKIKASSTASASIRGTSQNLVYLDEFAFVPNNIQESFFSSVYPTISSGTTTKVIITSTPNGLNLFYKLWADSENGRNSYKRIDVHWSQVPGRDEKWKEETIRNTSEDQFRQEYECEFLGSSSTLISGPKLKRLVYQDPIKSDEHLKIHSEPDPSRVYTMVVDTARGKEGDYSAFKIFDNTEFPYRDVVSYRNKEIDPVVYPSVVFRLAKEYNNCFVLVETNDIGQQVADILMHDFEYDNMMFTTNRNFEGVRLSGGHSGVSHAGVRTTKSVKKVGCSNFKSLVENDKLIINDYDTIQEMYRFIHKNNSYEAEEGNDDLVMCCVLFSWLTDQLYFKELTDLSFRKRLQEDNEKRIEAELLPFGFMDDKNDMKQPVLEVEEVTLDENMSFNKWLST